MTKETVSPLKQTLLDTLTAAADRVKAATTAHEASLSGLATAEANLKLAEATRMVSDWTGLGSNDTQRKANLLLSLSSEVEAVQTAEAAKLASATQLDLAKIDLSVAREMIKIHALGD